MLVVRCLAPKKKELTALQNSVKASAWQCTGMRWQCGMHWIYRVIRVCPRLSYQIRRASYQGALIIVSCQAVRLICNIVWPMLSGGSGRFGVWGSDEEDVEGLGFKLHKPFSVQNTVS